jgi:amino acid adenylation domain-containing protein
MTRPVGHTAVSDLLHEARTRYAHRPAVRDRDGGWTYRELAEQSDRYARSLRRYGVRAASRVVLLLPNGRPTAALIYAIAALGATAVPLSPGTPGYRLRWLLQNAQPTLVVVADGLAEANARYTTAAVVEIGWLPGRDLPPAGPVRSPVPTAPAFLLYTSGSTAQPRAVVCPHSAVLFATHAIAERLAYRPDDVIYCRLPLSFDYGLYQLFLATAGGAELILADDGVDAVLAREIRRCGATVVPVVPALADLLARSAARERRPSPVRLFTNTGATLTPRHDAALRSRWPRAAIVAMYGTTECKRVSIADPDEHLVHPGSVGRPLPGTGVAVVDDAGRVLGADTTGQFVVSGPHVMDGYWQDAELTAARFTTRDHGRGLQTGDFGYLDNAGRLYFVGRRDDLIKRRGVRTSTSEIEAAMLDIPAVRAAAVVSVGEGTITAWAQTDLPAEQVLREVSERLGRARTPDRCIVVTALPLTSNGKVDKQRLRGVREH